MKKILIVICLLSILLISGCGKYHSTGVCGYYTNEYHERDVENLGQALCWEKYKCNYYDFEDVCRTGKVVDKIYCDCNLKTIIIN